MKIEATVSGDLQITEAYNPVEFKTNAGEKFALMMRDSGYEFFYGGKMWEAKDGIVKPLQDKKPTFHSEIWMNSAWLESNGWKQDKKLTWTKGPNTIVYDGAVWIMNEHTRIEFVAHVQKYEENGSDQAGQVSNSDRGRG